MDHWTYIQHVRNQENGGPNYHRNRFYLALACFAVGTIVVWLIMHDTDSKEVPPKRLDNDEDLAPTVNSSLRSKAHIGLSVSDDGEEKQTPDVLK